MNWIRNPKKYKPKTVMPVLRVKLQDAVDIPEYLYSLGTPNRLERINETGADLP